MRIQKVEVVNSNKFIKTISKYELEDYRIKENNPNFCLVYKPNFGNKIILGLLVILEIVFLSWLNGAMNWLYPNGIDIIILFILCLLPFLYPIYSFNTKSDSILIVQSSRNNIKYCPKCGTEIGD